MASVLAHLSNMSAREAPLHKILAYKDILLSPIQHSVYVEEKRKELTRLEYDLLRYFMENRGIDLESIRELTKSTKGIKWELG